jgi:hypothetical protein
MASSENIPENPQSRAIGSLSKWENIRVKCGSLSKMDVVYKRAKGYDNTNKDAI